MLARKEPVTTLDRIQHALAIADASNAFASRRTVGVDDLHLDVDAVGSIPLPLSPSLARKLSKVAHAARYGLREQTLLDSRVRDTWEIDAGNVRIDGKRWQRTIGSELEHVAKNLGLPAGVKLRAELHNLLLYGPGQFFAPHQDSEKADGMIGSLVVLLPSDSKGGALVIEHHDQKLSVRGSSEQLVFVAFYADCRHQVRPVTAGYRAALTYNLFYESERLASRAPTGESIETLVDLVRTHFSTPRPAWGSRPSTGAPERLVYLLDHEYTQKGLAWTQLKSGDAVRAALLRQVAERLDCEIVLALADVHEVWSCEDNWDDGYGYGRRRRRWYDADDGGDDEKSDSEDYKLIELCDSDIELRHWVAPSGKRTQSISDEVLGDEVCYTKPSADLAPFKSEHEGYTGNAGNTVDRWYHRAAVLMWPRARTFAIRARAAPAWAIREITKTLARGATERATKDIGEMLPFWKVVARREQDAAFVDPILRAAVEIDDANLAAALLEPIEIEHLVPRLKTRLVELLARYGLSWCERMFELWTLYEARAYEHEPRAKWISALPELCAPLCRAGKDGIALARRLQTLQWKWLEQQLRRLCDNPPSSHVLRAIERSSPAIVGILALAGLTSDRDLQPKICEFLQGDGFPIEAAVAVVRAGVARRDAKALGLRPLHEYCTRVLSGLVGAPPRTADDWSITAPLRCKCELCTRLGRFLRDAKEQLLEWPLAKERRRHVHEVIKSHELPMTHVTRHVGSPHTLVLTKTKALFTRDARKRDLWTHDLAWLRKIAKTFAGQQRKTAISRSFR